MIIWATNAWDQKKNSIHIFYSLNKTNISLILNISYLQTEDIIINYITSSWYWGIKALKHEIFKPKKFEKILKNKPVVYALILGNKNEDITTLIIFYEIINYTDVFSKKNVRKLPKHKKGNHVIELNEQNSSFELLYNLLSLELKTLQEYFDNALVKRWIRHFTSSAETSVLFISKRNSGLHLCVNY